MRLPSRPAAIVALCMTLVLAGDGPMGRPRPRPAGEAVLERRIVALTRLLADMGEGPLVPPDDVLLVVDQRLVQNLLDAVLPIEQLFKDNYLIELREAWVEFEDGFALVRLGGRASLAKDLKTGVEITVFGAFIVEGFEPTSGILHGRVEVVAVDVERVDVRGISAPLERLVEDLGREKLESYEALLGDIEVPVRLEHEVVVPGLGPAGGIRIAPLRLPLKVAISAVRAFGGKLWLSVSARGIEPDRAIEPIRRPEPRAKGRPG
jgi:hypothetical protein